VKVVVIAQYPIERKGIISIISKQNNIQVSGEAATLTEGLNLLKDAKPDIAIVDTKLGDSTGLDLITMAKEKDISCKFILIGYIYEEDFISRALKSGVEGYLLRDAYPEDIIYAINQVIRGRQYFDAAILEYVLDARKPNISLLTPRETEILMELGKGLSNKQIAKIHYITEHTVKKHISRILRKLELKDRTQAAIYANKLRTGI